MCAGCMYVCRMNKIHEKRHFPEVLYWDYLALVWCKPLFHGSSRKNIHKEKVFKIVQMCVSICVCMLSVFMYVFIYVC